MQVFEGDTVVFGCEVNAGILQAETVVGQLLLDLIDRLLTEVTNVQQIFLRACNQLPEGVDTLALEAVVRPRLQVQVLDRQCQILGEGLIRRLIAKLQEAPA